MSDSAAVSFIVRRPTPVSRGESPGAESDDQGFKVPALPRHLTDKRKPGSSPLARSREASPRVKPQARTFEERDSSDEEDEATDELVTGFDQFGVQRLHEKKKPDGPLVIAPLQNKDWREVAKKRRTSERFVPVSAAAQTGADGSVGGLGTRDAINSGPQLSGLQKRAKLEHDGDMDIDSTIAAAPSLVKEEAEEDEDKRALRALLAGDSDGGDERTIDAIPIRTLSEAEALKQDVEALPEVASLADYDRVPVAQFGAAMLRGMGWKEGMAASRGGKSGKGDVQPWLPEARPLFLGIGAKEREVLDDGSDPRKRKKRPDLKYVPIVKKEREDSNGSAPRSDRDGRERDVERYRDSRPSDKDRDGRQTDSRSSDRDRERRDRDSGDRDRRSVPSSRERDHDRRERDYKYDKKEDRRDRDYERDRSRSDHHGGESSRRNRDDDRRRSEKYR